MLQSYINRILVVLKGIAMGAADVVPGVSGGTIAFILGIYEELIESINKVDFSFFSIWKKQGFKTAWLHINGAFLLALFIGIAISIFSLSKLIKWLLFNHDILLWAFFFGLVLASVVYIAKQITKWHIVNVIVLLAVVVLSYYITNLKPFTSPDSNLYFMFCGFVAIIAMILPGVSGAFILILLGAYEAALEVVDNLIEGVTTFNFERIKMAFIKFLMFAIGAVLGLKTFSKLLNWMFKNYKNLTLSILCGFMIGSLNKIWPWKNVLIWRKNHDGIDVPFQTESISPFSYQGDNQLMLAVVLFVIGFACIFILERFSAKPTR